MDRVVYVLTAWNERTGEDVIRVFAEKAAADKGVAPVRGPARDLRSIYRRTVQGG